MNETKAERQEGRKARKEGRKEGEMESLCEAPSSTRKRRKHSHLKTVRHDGSIGLIYFLT